MSSINPVGNQNSFVSSNIQRKESAGKALQVTRNASIHNPDNKTAQDKRPAKRGFAAMDPARQREIAAQGGRAAHESGNAHQFTSEEARAAGKKSHSGWRRGTADAVGSRNNDVLPTVGKSSQIADRATAGGSASTSLPN